MAISWVGLFVFFWSNSAKFCIPQNFALFLAFYHAVSSQLSWLISPHATCSPTLASQLGFIKNCWCTCKQSHIQVQFCNITMNWSSYIRTNNTLVFTLTILKPRTFSSVCPYLKLAHSSIWQTVWGWWSSLWSWISTWEVGWDLLSPALLWKSWQPCLPSSGRQWWRKAGLLSCSWRLWQLGTAIHEKGGSQAL